MIECRMVSCDHGRSSNETLGALSLKQIFASLGKVSKFTAGVYEETCKQGRHIFKMTTIKTGLYIEMTK